MKCLQSCSCFCSSSSPKLDDDVRQETAVQEVAISVRYGKDLLNSGCSGNFREMVLKESNGADTSVRWGGQQPKIENQ